jgi:hypothetical protein
LEINPALLLEGDNGKLFLFLLQLGVVFIEKHTHKEIHKEERPQADENNAEYRSDCEIIIDLRTRRGLVTVNDVFIDQRPSL